MKNRIAILFLSFAFCLSLLPQLPAHAEEKIKSGNIHPDNLHDTSLILENVRKLGLNTINVPVRINIADVNSNDISIDQASKANAISLIDELNNRGVKVILEAYPYINGGTVSEVNYLPSDINSFFWDWKTEIWDELIRDIANPKNVYAVIIASNFDQLESSTGYWQGVISDVRSKYSGLVSYKTNWWSTASWDSASTDKYFSKLYTTPFSDVDFISIAAYFELSEKAVPTTDELIQSLRSTTIHNRQQNVYQEIKNFYDLYNKPIYLAELGIPAVQYGTSAPWNPSVNATISEETQNNAFLAYQSVFGHEDWFIGYSVFQINLPSNEYYPVGKLVETTIKSFQPRDYEETNVSLSEGTLNFQYNPLVFGNTVIDTTAPQTSTANTVITVNDSRGSGNGWDLSLSITDFQSGAIPDPTSTGDIQVSFPSNSVSAALASPNKIAGQNVKSLVGPVVENKTLSNVPQKLFTSPQGFGMGIYDSTAVFTIDFPKATKVLSVSSADSKYSINDEVGLFSTTYNSTFTFTLSSGI